MGKIKENKLNRKNDKKKKKGSEKGLKEGLNVRKESWMK
jgi:ribosomal protein L19E